MLWLKQVHVTLVALTIAGFVMRGFWAWRAPRLLRAAPVRVAPHLIDSLLLASGVGLLVSHGWNPLAHGWLLAKLGLLLVYIGLGMVALKQRFVPAARISAFLAAVAVFAWMVAIARGHRFVPFAG